MYQPSHWSHQDPASGPEVTGPTPPPHSGPPGPDGYTVPNQYHGLGPQEIRDASMAHYLGILTWIVPVVMRSNAGAFSGFVRAHATAAANMQFTLMICSFGSLLLICGLSLPVAIGFGAPTLMLVGGGLAALAQLGVVTWSIVGGVRGGNAAKIGFPPPKTGAFPLLK